MSDYYIAKHIKKYRKLQHLTQAELAEKIGISQMSIRRYEAEGTMNREPALSTLKKIEETLNVPRDKQIFYNYKNEITENDEDIDFINQFKGLNERGKNKVRDYINDITKIEEYKK